MKSLLWVMLAAYSFSAVAGEDSYIPPPLVLLEVFGRLGPSPKVSAAKAELGLRLFNDTRLSGDGRLACASCHLAAYGYTTPTAMSPAAYGRAERRNAPTLINVAYVDLLLWDGRVEELDEQPVGSLKNPLHLNGDIGEVVKLLEADSDYPASFAAAFGDEAITGQRIGQAIGAYERTLIYGDSPFDRYMAGDLDALDEPEKRGLGLFMRDGRCITCHFGPNLTDNGFHNIAVPDDHVTNDRDIVAAIRFDGERRGYEGWASLNHDPGRALVTHDADDVGKFRTMTLRNIAETAPYMHNGAYATLAEVVAHYSRGGGNHPNKSRRIRRLNLSAAQQADLVAFLKALTGRLRP